MDQVKSLARAAAKHIFWIGCGAILAVSMGVWFVARNSLHNEFDTNEGQINSKFQTVSQLKSKTNPPTDKSHAEMDKLLKGTLDKVVAAWQKQYSHQEDILVWDNRLHSDFISKVRPLKPIELKIAYPTPTNQEISPDLRQRYATYVDNLLPVLAEMIGTDWRVGLRRNAVPGMGTAGPSGVLAQRPKPPKILWDEKDQQRLVGTHFNWSSQNDIPRTLQVLYAQEDLWVYTALMYIIAQTNGPIESRHEAVVKTIETILIGRGAIGRSGQVTSLTGGSGMGGYGGGGYGGEGYGEDYGGEESSDEEMGGAMGGMSGPAMGGGMSPAMGAMGGEMGGEMGDEMGESGYGGMGGMSASRDPAEGRYVDNDYLPLSAQRLRDALQSGSPDDAFLVVAKRMPIRMRLIVDQRKIPRLLAAFGNSRLPVEVRQVRINRQGTSSGSGGYGGGYGGGSEGGYEGGGYEGGGYGGGMMSPGSMGGGMSPGSMGGMSPGGSGGYEGGGYESGGYEGGDYEGGDYESGGYEGGGGYGADAAFGGGGYGAGGYGAGNVRDRNQLSSTSKHDVPVEIYGIIYIYNPVDRKKLGLDQDPVLSGPVEPEAAPTG